MSKYVGTIGERISREVVLVGDFSYETRFGFVSQTNYIYTMQDADGNVFVWKTTKSLFFDVENEKEPDVYDCDCIRKGDTMKITGTVKEHSDYKGTNQTVLTRCKFSLISHKPDEQIKKREQQVVSLADGDFIWEMPYKQYKEHYADCETVVGSYVQHENSASTIKVIIRKGRLKNSGVRGKHFSGYSFVTPDGKYTCTYRAVSEENARKQLKKDYDNSKNWEVYAIYR